MINIMSNKEEFAIKISQLLMQYAKNMKRAALDGKTDVDNNVQKNVSDLAPHKQTHTKAMLDHMNSSFVKLTPVTIFECGFCASCFASNKILKEHQRKHYKKTMPYPLPEPKPSVPIECRVNGNTVFVDRDKKGLYHCSFCDAAFKVGKHFRDHMQLKHGWSFDFMNTCDICGKTLKSTSNKKLHMLVHTGERPYSCHICNQRFTQSAVVKYHIKRIHTRERDFACSMCPKKFSEKAKMQIHQRTHTGEKPYVCRTCSKPFSDRSAWKRHEVIHTGLKPHRCTSCPAAFCDPAALFRHKRSHADYRAQCTLCPRSFASTVSLRVHMQLLHSTLRERDKFQCDHCGKKFLTKSYMANHIKNMHVMANNKSTKPKYACDICGAWLRPKSMAQHVVKVHLRRYPHKCQQCGRRFVYMNELNKHWVRVHGPEPPDHLQCDHCRATYADKVILIQHMAYQHLGHKCTTCKKCFNTSQCLKRHRKKGCLRCDV